MHTCTHAHAGSRRDAPVEDGANSSTVGAASVDVQPRGQEDAVLHRDGAVGEGGDQQLVPPCTDKKVALREACHTRASWIAIQGGHYYPLE